MGKSLVPNVMHLQITNVKQEPDYYINEEGLVVMTESFLKKRGFCCGNGSNIVRIPSPGKRGILSLQTRVPEFVSWQYTC